MSEPDWIKADDYHPKNREWVLVSNGVKVIMAQYMEQTNTFYLQDKLVPATNWMPMPKPPKRVTP